MSLALSLGIAAGVLQLVGFVFYNKQIFQGRSVPNAATWTIWAFIGLLNGFSYAAMTGDAAKYFLPVASALACVATFGYSLSAGKFKRLDFWDWLVLILGTIGGIVWWWSRSAIYANFIIVIAEIIAFSPLMRGVWKNPAFERPLPWFIWTAAYGMNTAAVFLHWTNQYQDLFFPVSMIILHFTVAFLSLRKAPAPVPAR